MGGGGLNRGRGLNGRNTVCLFKEHVKLIQWVKIAHSFLHVMSKLFQPIIFSLSFFCFQKFLLRIFNLCTYVFV